MGTHETTEDAWLDPLAQLDQTKSLPVEAFVTFRVNQLSAAFERQWTRFMREQAGVSLSEWRILAMLQNGPATSSKVIEGTGMNKALLSRSAHQLSEMGFVKIATTPGDARSITLGLTSAGQKVLARVKPLALKRQRHFLSVLSANERQVLYGALDKLRQAAVQWDTGSD